MHSHPRYKALHRRAFMIAPSGEGGGGDGAKGGTMREGIPGGRDKEVGYINRIQQLQDTNPMPQSFFS